MSHFLKSREFCPIHKSFKCSCHKPSKSSPRTVAGRGGRAALSPLMGRPPRFKVAVERVVDEFSPNGFREICNTQEKRRRKMAHIIAQDAVCPLCNQLMENFRDVEFCHKQSKGMGGAKTDDSFSNTFAGHRWCNFEQGSKPFAPSPANSGGVSNEQTAAGESKEVA